MSHRLDNAVTLHTHAPGSDIVGEVRAAGRTPATPSAHASPSAAAGSPVDALGASFAVQLVAIFGVYLVFRRLLLPWIGPLPESICERSSILAAALAHPTFIIAAGACCLVPFVAWKRLHWCQLESGNALRWTILLIVLTPAYAFATYDYNYYFDQWHTADRILVSALALLVVWHPAFVMPAVVACLVIVGQFYHPMLDFSWTDKHMPFDVLIVSVHSCTSGSFWESPPHA